MWLLLQFVWLCFLLSLGLNSQHQSKVPEYPDKLRCGLRSFQFTINPLSQETETPPALVAWGDHGPHSLQNDSGRGTWVSEGLAAPWWGKPPTVAACHWVGLLLHHDCWKWKSRCECIWSSYRDKAVQGSCESPRCPKCWPLWLCPSVGQTAMCSFTHHSRRLQTARLLLQLWRGHFLLLWKHRWVTMFLKLAEECL